MFRSYRVGTLYGVPIRLDVTFLLVLPVFAWALGAQIDEAVSLLNGLFGVGIDPGPLTAGLAPVLIGAVAAVALFGCVVLHELGHSVTAIRYGYEVESITLWFLGGLAKPAEQPKNWLHEFWIAVAGPLVNVAIAALCGVVLFVLPPADVASFLVLYLGVLNIGLAIFNMLPAFPLDGGRVLRALLARNQDYVTATRRAARVGKGFAVVLGVFGIFTVDFVLVGIALFVYIAATSESRQMLLNAAFEGVGIAEVMTPADELVSVEAEMPVSELLDIMLEQRHSGYPVLDGGDFVGIVTLEDIQAVDRPGVVATDVMTPAEDLVTVDPSEDVVEAFQTVGNKDIGRLPVVDKRRLIGIVTRTDLMRAFEIATAKDQFEGVRSDIVDTSTWRDSPNEPTDDDHSEWETKR